MDKWVTLSQHEGFKLVALMCSELGWLVPTQGSVWRRILEERRIPVISQSEFIVRHSYRASDEHFLRNGHWNAQGHRWAAQGLTEFFLEHRADYLVPQVAATAGRQ
jgi:hypothetical protein